MDVKQLIKELEKQNPDDVVCISDGVGWTNLDHIEKNGSCVYLIMQKFPIFSDN